MTAVKAPESARPLPSEPRYEIAFEVGPPSRQSSTIQSSTIQSSTVRSTTLKPGVPGLFASLKALGERSGAAVGGAYAQAARSVLRRIERLEDSNAERRLRQRTAAPASAARAAAPAPRTEPTVPSK